MSAPHTDHHFHPHFQAFPAYILTPLANIKLAAGPVSITFVNLLERNLCFFFKSKLLLNSHTAMTLIGGLTGFWIIALLTLHSANVGGNFC